jgi:hypothetical protein
MAASADSVRTLRDQLFRQPETHANVSQRVPVMSALGQRTKVYVLPSTSAADVETVKAFHLFLIVAGTSSSSSKQEWRNFVVTIAGLCFEDMKTAILTSAAYEEVVVSAGFVTQLQNWYDAYKVATDLAGDDADLRTSCQADIVNELPLLDLPRGVASHEANLDDVLDLESVYGHFSLVLFLAGKTITDRNRAAITEKRPSAIERKYYDGRQVASLSGKLALSTVAHSQVHSAFVALTHARIVIFEQVALFNKQTGIFQFEIVATTTRLMRFAGMQQAAIIDAFLASHEEAFRVPMLAPAIAAYTASLRDVARASDEIRPYYKVIYGDTTRAFNRNDLENLLVVALEDASLVTPSLKQFNRPPNTAIIMERYQQSLALLEEADDSS